MRNENSLRLTRALNRYITEAVPVIRYTQKQLLSARESYSEEELSLLRTAGWLGEDFECFYVINRFLTECGAMDRAEDQWLKQVFSQAKRYTKKGFFQDPYLSRITVPEKQIGRFQLKMVSYERGELLQYDMPDLSLEHITPKLAFFTEKVTFPAVYEGSMPWVSVCPSEINSMQPDTLSAFGRVLVLGLGLGYYPYMISAMEQVREIVIVQLQQEVIDLFEQHILWQFPRKDKITVVKADAFDYLASLEDGEFDFCYADIWEGEEDGAYCYRRILPEEKRMPHTRFAYWIHDAIRRRMEEEDENEDSHIEA